MGMRKLVKRAKVKLNYIVKIKNEHGNETHTFRLDFFCAIGTLNERPKLIHDANNN